MTRTISLATLFGAVTVSIASAVPTDSMRQ